MMNNPQEIHPQEIHLWKIFGNILRYAIAIIFGNVLRNSLSSFRATNLEIHPYYHKVHPQDIAIHFDQLHIYFRIKPLSILSASYNCQVLWRFSKSYLSKMTSDLLLTLLILAQSDWLKCLSNNGLVKASTLSVH